MTKKIQAKFNVKVTVPFFAYDTNKENKLALLQIKQQIEELLENQIFDLDIIPDEQEATGEIKFKVTSLTKV